MSLDLGECWYCFANLVVCMGILSKCKSFVLEFSGSLSIPCCWGIFPSNTLSGVLNGTNGPDGWWYSSGTSPDVSTVSMLAVLVNCVCLLYLWLCNNSGLLPVFNLQWVEMYDWFWLTSHWDLERLYILCTFSCFPFTKSIGELLISSLFNQNFLGNHFFFYNWT